MPRLLPSPRPLGASVPRPAATVARGGRRLFAGVLCLVAATAAGPPHALGAQSPVSASVQAQVRIVDGTRLQARQLGELRLVRRDREHDEYALTVHVASTVPWQLAVGSVVMAGIDGAPANSAGVAARAHEVEARDAHGFWHALEQTGTPTVVQVGDGGREPREVVVHFRVSGSERRESRIRPRLLLSPTAY